MASETEASCESDPNFAIICAFLEKFGDICGIESIDFVELQNMLENNQEVASELMNIHIKLLRKTKKNVTVERWERALINMCHNYSSKDAWEIERFGYKKTRLQVRLRALKELLEMQFDLNTKFKNEVNKMSAESLRAQPLGRDKLGRAYWFQTDNNYQIRIYKEDPDEETWHLVAKDREGLLSLINELADGDSKLSSDSALNEDSNSLSEKPFIDTGQMENSIQKNLHNIESESNEATLTDISLKEEKNIVEPEPEKGDEAMQGVEPVTEGNAMEAIENDYEEKSSESDSEEVKKPPVLRIKSLSELMEEPEECEKTNSVSDSSEVIIKKPRLESELTKTPNGEKEVEEPSEIESPSLPTTGTSSGSDNKSLNVNISEAIEEEVMFIQGEGRGADCTSGNDFVIVSEEIEEEVMFIYGEGSGAECETGNEKEQTSKQENEKPDESQEKVPIDSEKPKEESVSVKKTQFFFGPGSLNIKPCPVSPVINVSLPEETNSKPDVSNNGSISKETEEKENGSIEGTLKSKEEVEETSNSMVDVELNIEKEKRDDSERVENSEDGEKEESSSTPIDNQKDVDGVAKPQDDEKTTDCVVIENEQSKVKIGEEKDDSKLEIGESLVEKIEENHGEIENQTIIRNKDEEETITEEKMKESITNIDCGKDEELEKTNSDEIADKTDLVEMKEIEEPNESKGEKEENDFSDKKQIIVGMEHIEEKHSDYQKDNKNDDIEEDNEKEEDETIEEPKENNEEPASKRKRVTRNSSTLNDSVTEETLNPSKKAPVEKTKKKGVEKTNDEETDTEARQTRQTRQTRGSKTQTPSVAVKSRGKSKKNSPQASKSDEADSPAPLESVTIVDTDASSAAAENPEKDPLAVSEEEQGTATATISSITGFSFDYNPDSPAPEKAKRGPQKRGRETLEEKPEEEIKKPRMRGRRSVDQTLRKSVEEKRQQVGEGSSDENEQTKGKGAKKSATKKAVTPTASDSDSSSAKGKKRAGRKARLLKNLGVKAEDLSSMVESPAPVRQSRRLAQIKIKEEATRKRGEEEETSSKKKKKKSDDKVKVK